MDRIIRCITSDGSIMATAIDSTDLVYKASVIHKTSPVASAALGRLLSATSMMGSQLKQKDAFVNIRIMGDGPLGPVIAVSDSSGNVKGYVGNSDCVTTHYENGKLNVGEAVGKNGVLNVMKDLGTGEPYIGTVPLVSGEIAEDITSYFANSEQIPTVCSLGVLIDKETKQVLLSGGLLIQLLPGAFDDTIDKLEKNIESLESVTAMLLKGMSIEDMVKTALKGFEVEILDEYEVKYVCSCSRDTISDLILKMPDEEIADMIEKDHKAEAFCHFCNKKYEFSEKDLRDLLDKKQKVE